jgi:hypothetical protein
MRYGGTHQCFREIINHIDKAAAVKKFEDFVEWKDDPDVRFVGKFYHLYFGNVRLGGVNLAKSSRELWLIDGPYIMTDRQSRESYDDLKDAKDRVFGFAKAAMPKDLFD